MNTICTFFAACILCHDVDINTVIFLKVKKNAKICKMKVK